MGILDMRTLSKKLKRRVYRKLMPEWQFWVFISALLILWVFFLKIDVFLNPHTDEYAFDENYISSQDEFYDIKHASKSKVFQEKLETGR